MNRSRVSLLRRMSGADSGPVPVGEFPPGSVQMMPPVFKFPAPKPPPPVVDCGPGNIMINGKCQKLPDIPPPIGGPGGTPSVPFPPLPPIDLPIDVPGGQSSQGQGLPGQTPPPQLPGGGKPPSRGELTGRTTRDTGLSKPARYAVGVGVGGAVAAGLGALAGGPKRRATGAIVGGLLGALVGAGVVAATGDR